MRIKKWMRAFSPERDAATELAAFSRAAATGDALERLLELAAEELLKLAAADRAGVWVESEVRQIFRGLALDAHGAAPAPEWRQLEIAAFPWQHVLRSSTPLIADLHSEPPEPAPGDAGVFVPPVLAEMQSAVWWPVRYSGRAVGVALLAFRAQHMSVSEAVSPYIWSLLNQLALAYQAQRGREASAPAPQGDGQELRALLEAVDSGVLLFDAAGKIRSLNEQFARLFGLEKTAVARLIGSSIEELHSIIVPLIRDPDTFSRRWRELPLLGNSTAWDEVELLNPAGRVLQRFSRPVTDSQGRRSGWLELYRERSVHAAPHLPMLQTEKMAAIGQLVSGIAHELNNPLTSIMGYAQLLLARIPGRRIGGTERRRESEAMREMSREAEKIYTEAERAGRIVNNLLLFARSGRGERRAVDLNEVVERTLALRSYELKVENIHVDLQLDPDLPPTLADPHQVQQVVLNLLVNAEQAILENYAAERAETPGGAEIGRIRMRTHSAPQAQPPRVTLEISDSGPGVPPQQVSRIFDPFFTTKPIGLGTGLGLSIAYGIVHDHGGDIYLLDSAASSSASPPLRGATFVVEFPVLSGAEFLPLEPAGFHDEEPAQCVEAELESRPGPVEDRRGRILVVEDEPTVAQLIADVLKDEGYGVDVVLDSREALAQVMNVGYDLIVCDLRMPRLDGRAFYRALVRSGHPAQLRLLFVTGDTLSPRTLDFLDRTGLPCLAKPFLVEELKSMVARTLDSVRKPPNGAAPERRFTDSAGNDESEPHTDAVPSTLERRTEGLRKQ